MIPRITENHKIFDSQRDIEKRKFSLISSIYQAGYNKFSDWIQNCRAECKP